MNALFNVTSWRVCAASLAVAATGFLAACGGGGDAGPAAPSSNPPAASGNPAPSPAPTPNADSASFLIVLKIQGQGGLRYFAFGSGFAVDSRLIATNSHVTRGVLETARGLAARGERVVGVSAFQSETGREFALLEALVHPSYTGSTRSPDVGLFVARDSLPQQLALATPEEAGLLRKGDSMQVNGFPGDVFKQIIGNQFQPGLTVAQASLFSGTVQALRNFDERVVVNPPSERTVDYFEHSADTSGGTSGSPMIRNNKVIGVHNAGVIDVVVRPGPNGELVVDREILATASFGIHVKHLHNLIKEYNTGVLEADKRFRLPPDDALVAARPAGQTSAGGGAGSQFKGTVASPNNANVAHQISLSVDQNLNVSGTTVWPANASLGLGARQFSIRGTAKANGEVEFADNTPEVVPGFRRGVYRGNLNAASGRFAGQYYEFNESTNELFYFGDWTAAR